MRWTRRWPAARARWRVRIQALARAARQVLGGPDYAAYLEHCRRAGHPPQHSEREFLDASFAERGRAPRCC